MQMKSFRSLQNNEAFIGLSQQREFNEKYASQRLKLLQSNGFSNFYNSQENAII